MLRLAQAIGSAVRLYSVSEMYSNLQGFHCRCTSPSNNKTHRVWCLCLVWQYCFDLGAMLCCVGRVNYTAKLASNGAVFDSSYQRQQPLIFKVRAMLAAQHACNSRWASTAEEVHLQWL